MKKRIIQIVGILGGVSDYAQCLGSCWEAAGYESTTVSVFDGRIANRRIFKELLPESGVGAEVCGVIVHFSGYGYAHRGLCFWLLGELSALRRKLPAQIPVVLVYHELFAGGSLWSSAFWLQPLQRRIARQLARIGDVVWTNTEKHQAWLQDQVQPGVTVQRYPVFSNIGELQADLRPFADRSETAIVFGSEGTRRRFFQKVQTYFTATPFRSGVRLVEIGPGTAVAPAFRIPSEFLGKLPVDEVCRLMRDSRYGFIEYPGRYLAKSSVMAAYAAHGMLVCNAADELGPADGLRMGSHYVPFDSVDLKRLADNAVIGRNLERWYADHRLDFQAGKMIRLIVQTDWANPGH